MLRERESIKDMSFCYLFKENKRVVSILYLYIHCMIIPHSSSSVVIPASLVRGHREGEQSYAVVVQAGTPPQKFTLEVSFSTDQIVLFRDIFRFSQSYTNQNGFESDIFYVADQRFRLKFISNLNRFTPSFQLNCSRCDGLLGLSRGSLLWRLYPEITLTSVSVTLGGTNEALISANGCSGALIRCEPYTDDSLCATEGSVDGINYTIKFSVESPYTYLPIDLFDKFVQGNNVYETADERWIPISISLVRVKRDEIGDSVLSHMQSRDIDLTSCKGEITVTLDPQYMIGKSDSGMRILLIKPNEDSTDNTIRIGTSSWNQFIFYKNTVWNTMIVHAHTVQPNMTVMNLILFSVMIWFLVRWKMTDVSVVLYSKQDEGKTWKNLWSSDQPTSSSTQEPQSLTRREIIINLLYEVGAIPLVVTIFFLPQTTNIMMDFPVVYWISFSFFLISVIVEVMSLRSLLIRSTNRVRRRSRLSSSLVVHICLARNIAYENNLILGLWLCVVQRRNEGIATLLTVLLNVYGVYNLTFHMIMTLVFYIKAKPVLGKRNGIVWLYTSVIVPIMYAFYLFATYRYFVHPLMERNATIYRQLIVPTIIFAYLFIFNIAVFMASLYINIGEKKIVSEHIQIQNILQNRKDRNQIHSENNRENAFQNTRSRTRQITLNVSD